MTQLLMQRDQDRVSSRSQSRTSHFCKFVPKHSPATVKIFVIWQKAGSAKNDVIAIVCYSTALFPQVLHLQSQVRLLNNITSGPDYFTNWPFQRWVGCWVTLYYLTVTAVRRHCTDWYEIWALTDPEIYYIKIELDLRKFSNGPFSERKKVFG